jgi:hypothetical protein
MRSKHSLLLAALLPALVAAACTAGSASPGATTSNGSPPAIAPPASPVPESPSGGASGPTVGGPGITPIPVPPSGPTASGLPIPAPSPTEVVPISGLHNVHDVNATKVEARMSGNHIIATLFWWSGPSPCSDLSEVKVDRTGPAFTLTVREGARNLGIACPAIAMYKTTTVDLGAVAPGAYTVNAYGAEKPARVTFTG